MLPPLPKQLRTERDATEAGSGGAFKPAAPHTGTERNCRPGTVTGRELALNWTRTGFKLD